MISTIGCCRSMGRPSIIRRTWGRWSHSRRRPAARSGLRLIPVKSRARFGGNGSERDLNPAVVHDGRVFVAPSDADAIFAFDAGSGRLLWKSDPIADDVKLSHLLGVAKDRLVATGNRVLLFDVKTGRTAPCLARCRQVAGGLWPRAPGGRFHLLADARTRSRSSTSGRRYGPSRRSSCGRRITPRGGTWSRGTDT